MRAFVAILLPPIEGPLPAGLRPEDHLTLHFFEDLPPDRVGAVVEALRETAAATVPFELECRGLGAFPNVVQPRVLWAGVATGAPAVQELAGHLRKALSSRGFVTETRPFVPHRTLGRLRSPGPRRWATAFLTAPENVARTWAKSWVTELLLEKSELGPQGARHTVLERVRLSSPVRTEGLAGTDPARDAQGRPALGPTRF
jgi:2'-5' RNA ligase